MRPPMGLWRLAVLISILVGFWTLVIAGLAWAAEKATHKCHFYTQADAEWSETVTVLDAAQHGQTIYMLVRTHDGCRCMLELAPGVTPPTDERTVKIHGLRLGIPGVTRLQLIVLEIEDRA
jgi:hypothetical protein